MGSATNAYTTVIILEYPLPVCPVYRPIRFRVSTTVSTDELQMKGELYTRETITDAWILRATKMERPYLNEDYFLFDFAEILQGLLTQDRVDDGASYALQTPNDQSTVEFKVKFTEVYNDGNGYPAEYNYMFSVVAVAVNACKQIDESKHLILFTITDHTNRDYSNDFSADFK